MSLWIIRAGRHGEYENFALDNNVVVAGWQKLPDLSGIKSREELETLIRATYPDLKPGAIPNWTGQLWAVLKRIEENDLVALPLKTRSAIAFGKVIGPYQYLADSPSDAKHARPVEWLRTDLPRSVFDQDLLYTFGSALTVFQAKRNNAEVRVRAILQGKKIEPPVVDIESTEEEESLAESRDLDEISRDQIRDYLGRKFRGHKLAALVADVLQAQDYMVQVSPAGPDGGIDILAGRGPMGFDPPKLAVQVKSSDAPADVSVLRELQGVIPSFGADQGLIVSWGGFKSSVYKEARQLFFQVRLWDADDVVAAVQDHYESLSDEVQAELPLKRTWTLVVEE